MATLNKKNETVVAPFHKNGVTLQYLMLAFPSTVAAKLDTDFVSYSGSAARSPVAVALEIIAQHVSIEIIGTVQNISSGAGRDLRIAVAAPGGVYPSQTYDGTNSETLAVFLTSEMTGTYQGVNLASVVVSDVTF